MLGTIRKGLSLIPADRRMKFALVAFLGVVVTTLEAISAILVLILLRLVLDPGEVPSVPVVGDLRQALPGWSFEQLAMFGSIAFGSFFILRAVVFLLQQYALARVVENTGVVLSARIVRGYLCMPYEFHLQRNSSEFIRNAYDNVQLLINSVYMPISVIVAETLMVLGLLSILIIASPYATFLAIIVMGGLVAVGLVGVQPRLRAAGRQRQNAAARTLQYLQQGFHGLRDIKVLGRERAFERSFTGVRNVMARAQYRRAALLYVPRVMLETSLLLAIVAVLAIAILQDSVGGLLSTLGLFAYAGLRMQPSVQKIMEGLNQMRFAQAVVEDFSRELALTESAIESQSASPVDSQVLSFEEAEAIEFRDVSFRYSGADGYALSNVDLCIRRGDSIGVCGETGGGKTTFLDLLCGLLTPTDGAIIVDGVDVRRAIRAWQGNIGVVHQSSFLIDDTLRRNIALGLSDKEIDEQAVALAVETAELGDLAESLPLGLDTIVGERGVRLSGGQRQRVTLARALYRQPAILVMDEGTSALDNATEARVMHRLMDETRDTTLIMVAHRLSTIERCDCIVYVEGGHVVATGTYSELVEGSAGFRAMAR